MLTAFACLLSPVAFPSAPFTTLNDFQENSAALTATVNHETNQGGFNAISSLRWSYETATLTIEAQPGLYDQVVLAIGAPDILERSEGATQTPSGQLFHLDRTQADFRLINITAMLGSQGYAELPVTFPDPGAMAVQVIGYVSAPFQGQYPDGVVFSAPVVMRWVHCEGQFFQSTGLLTDQADEYEISVGELNEFPAGGPIDPYSSDGSYSRFVSGTATLTGVGWSLSAPLEVDTVAGVIRSSGVAFSTLGELFPTIPQGVVTSVMDLGMDFSGDPVSLDTSFETEVEPRPTNKTYKTDEGNDVPSRQDGHKNSDDMTDAEADAHFDAQSAAGKIGGDGVVTKTGPPTDSYNCHGHTFMCGDDWKKAGVQKILDDNMTGPVKAVQEGDVAVYRDDAGKITHTGIVTMVMGGGATEIESKWGRGPKYKHAPDTVPTDYGTPEYHTPANRPGGNKLKCK